jgi:PAS domain S-box-containing protein
MTQTDAIVGMNEQVAAHLAEYERAALLARLRHEAAEKAAILDQMTDAVLVADGTGRIVLSNATARALFDVSDDDWPDIARNRQTWCVFDAEGCELPVAERPLMAALHGKTTRGEFRIVLGNGRQRWVWISAGPLRDEDGAIQGVVWVGHDTTEERERREREARGEKLRALGQMASGVAHDLNQYLGLVAGYGDLAIRSLDGPAPDLVSARQALDVAIRAAMDGAETVKRLLLFGRPSQDGPVGPVDVGELLREVAILTAPHWRNTAQEQGRPISMLVEVSGTTTVDGWASSLREALANLVFNAVDALPRGGTLRLAARCADGRVIVEVSDTGIGIPAEALPHIFEPFFSTKGERGTGLGLAIVYGVVERHQGTITATSEVGHGTTMTLSFPAARCPATPVVEPPVVPSAPGRRVLVVDDEPAITRMLGMMLTPHGHAVTTANSAEEALAELATAQAPYDLILSDLGLGAGMSGWDLLDRVRADGRDTSFVLSTGWGAQIDQAHARSRGASGVLSKPYRLADVLGVVARCP